MSRLSWPTWRADAFLIVFGLLGGLLVFYGVWAYAPGGVYVAAAALVVYTTVVSKLRVAVWGLPYPPGILSRRFSFLFGFLIGAHLLLYRWPGEPPWNLVAAGVYAAVVLAAMVVATRRGWWGWLD